MVYSMLILALGSVALTTGCGITENGAAATAGDSGVAGNSSTAGANIRDSAGGAGPSVAGTGGTVGHAGAGAASLTPEQIRTITYGECSKACSVVVAACPIEPYDNCLSDCRSVADLFFEFGRCGSAYYEVWACTSRITHEADIGCPQSDRGTATIKGCVDEQDRLLRCFAGM